MKNHYDKFKETLEELGIPFEENEESFSCAVKVDKTEFVFIKPELTFQCFINKSGDVNWSLRYEGKD